MRPDNYYFGGGPAESIIHPAVFVAMIIATILIFVLPRKYVIVPYFLIAFLTPLTQTIVIAGVHFFVLRVLIIAGWVRLAAVKFTSSGGLYEGRLGKLDKVFALWVVFRILAVALRFSFLPAALVPQMGFFLDALGGYFLLRYLIQDQEDVVRTIRLFALVTIVIGPAMLYEKTRHSNIFGYLGGIPITPGLREGAYRCQGPFRNPITAGCFGASVFPLFFWLWKSGKSTVIASLAMLGATIITVASASSTCVMAFASGVVVVGLWPVRKKMRFLRWSIVAGLVLLQIAMNAPFWFLITHFELVGGSSNYHRAMLVDQFVRHIGDWWLIGTNDNANWGWDMWDQANQYVAEGESGGLATFVCFIALICICFSWLGKARKLIEGEREKEWLLWLLGGSLFADMIAFFGISYYDQTSFGWYALLAMIGVSTMTALAQPAPVASQPIDKMYGGIPLVARNSVKQPELGARSFARR